jgi:predicted metalloprotease with PDZ domain
MKLNYKYSIENASQHLLGVEVNIPQALVQEHIGEHGLEVQFPAWRPGRYELGNFVKNLMQVKVYTAEGNELHAEKITKDKFLVRCKPSDSLKISYCYYANDLNAGSTFVDDNQMYVNPVNCSMYLVGAEHIPAEIIIDAPKEYTIATGLKKHGEVYVAASIHELMDSPFVATEKFQHQQWKQEGVIFHLWFFGECTPDFDKIITDFRKFTQVQLKAFGEFPVDEYHYFFHIVPFKFYHGVEHLNTTVIALGPDYELMQTELYENLLGVSSHELYHAWNIKSIRPAEMLPYDYSKENYSRMGYLAEGVTTYFGDTMLLKGEVFTLERYLKELTTLFQRYYDNFGRFNLSVADSSFDTWVDGYTPGTPHRKVSIYNEGALVAFMCDVAILHHTSGEKSLSDVMKILYHDYAKKEVGITQEIYIQTLNQVAGHDLSYLINNYIYDTQDYTAELQKTLNLLGLELKVEPSDNRYETSFGFKVDGNVQPIITNTCLGSEAEKRGLHRGDQILAINRRMVNEGLNKFFQQSQQSYELTVRRQNKLINITLSQAGEYYEKLTVVKKEENDLLLSWRKK